MQIVTDRGVDLAAQQLKELDVHFAPLKVTLSGRTYTAGVDLEPESFYELLSNTEDMPTTSQPSAGEFAELYRGLASTDPEILSIHMSSGLSGTMNSARAAAAMVPEAKITFFDTKTLSVPAGWQVQAAAKALKAGWPIDRILTLLAKIRDGSEGIFTLSSLKYLIHGGRISHMKGLVASLLNIKPVIGVEKTGGTYIPLAQEITFKRAIAKIGDLIAEWYPNKPRLRVQLLHGNNLEGLALLQERMQRFASVLYEPIAAIQPVLGAHTGASMVGMAVGPLDVFAEIP